MITLERTTIRAGAFALREVSLSIPGGSYAVLMGRTGSGKTTLLEAICGLRPVESGRILLGGEDVTHTTPAARGVGFVPQDGALFGHLTVRQHLEFSLIVRGWSETDRAARVRELSEWLGLGALLDRMPAGLSGGETQRVALGRALAFKPRVLCLDEPLSALDDTSREEICGVLQQVRKHTGVTALHITHNLAEAGRLGDCVLKLHNGSIQTQ